MNEDFDSHWHEKPPSPKWVFAAAFGFMLLCLGAIAWLML
jgi:hypothetical protein